MITTINTKRLDNMDRMMRTITSDGNRLIRELQARRDVPVVEITPPTGEVPWADFEERATKALGFSGMGWKYEFERQVGLREGVLKLWNHRGVIPVGFFHLCDMIHESTPGKASRLRWTKEEKAALAEFHSKGQTVLQIRQSMQERFGDRRNYLADGPVIGMLRRIGIKLREAS